MASYIKFVFTLTLMVSSFCPVFCWDSDDFELFDLVEEVQSNFYEYFGIEQTATTSEIRKAYRKLSLQYHPDKNDAEDAEQKFRQIVSIYEVLKDKEKREKYNQVLVEGLPDWRQPIYYYRRAHKMGLAELIIVLAVIVTIGQYFVSWGIYIERRLVLEEILSTKKKKEKKKKKQTSDIDIVDEEELSSIPTPRILGLWPFQLSVFLFSSVYNLPETIKQWKEDRQMRKEEAEEEARQRALELETEPEEIIRKPRKKAPAELPEYNEKMYASLELSASKSSAVANAKEKSTMQMKKGDWTDEELVMLSKAVNKFPGGTPQRWEKIADMIGRTVPEVTAKVKGTKGGYTINVSSTVQSSGYLADKSGMVKDEVASQIDGVVRDFEPKTDINQEVRKRSTKIPKPIEVEKNKTDETSLTWTQNQQTIFEWTLKQYPKGTEKRWDKVSEHIPGKTKEDCIARFKLLAEIIKKKKLGQENKDS